MTTLNPWDIRGDESAKAYAAFAAYRDMGPGRSQEAVGEKLGKSRQLLGRWAVTYSWTERARAYDEAAAKLAADASLEDHAAVNRRHAELGRVLQKRGAQRLALLPPETLSGAEAVSAVKAGVQVERDALGMATRTEVTGKDGAPLVPPQPPIICRPALPDEMPEE